MPVAGPPDVVAPIAIDDAVQKAKERAETAIDRARSIVGGAEFVTRFGDAVEVILELADEHEVDVIVVGTEEPGFFERLLRGSLSQAVARRGAPVMCSSCAEAELLEERLGPGPSNGGSSLTAAGSTSISTRSSKMPRTRSASTKWEPPNTPLANSIPVKMSCCSCQERARRLRPPRRHAPRHANPPRRESRPPVSGDPPRRSA